MGQSGYEESMAKQTNSVDSVSEGKLPWRTLVYTLLGSSTLIPAAIASGRVSGLSSLLVGVYIAAWAALAGRFAVHVYEGYLIRGLLRPMLCEALTVGVWGSLAWILSQSANPQIPRLIACAGTAMILFFFSASRMENRRADLIGSGNETKPRRATQVLRESRLWRDFCGRFRQLKSQPTERIAEAASGADTDAGSFSRISFALLSVPFAIGVVSVSCALAATVFHVPLTPAKKSGGTGKGGTEEISDAEPAPRVWRERQPRQGRA